MTATQSARILVTDPQELAEARAMNERIGAVLAAADARIAAEDRPVVAPPVANAVARAQAAESEAAK